MNPLRRLFILPTGESGIPLPARERGIPGQQWEILVPAPYAFQMMLLPEVGLPTARRFLEWCLARSLGAHSLAEHALYVRWLSISMAVGNSFEVCAFQDETGQIEISVRALFSCDLEDAEGTREIIQVAEELEAALEWVDAELLSEIGEGTEEDDGFAVYALKWIVTDWPLPAIEAKVENALAEIGERGMMLDEHECWLDQYLELSRMEEGGSHASGDLGVHE